MCHEPRCVIFVLARMLHTENEAKWGPTAPDDVFVRQVAVNFISTKKKKVLMEIFFPPQCFFIVVLMTRRMTRHHLG